MRISAAFDYLQTAQEGLWIVLVFWALAFFVGLGPTSLLLPAEWRKYRLLIAPVLGWHLLVLGLLALNLFVSVRIGVWVILVLSGALNVFCFWGRLSRREEEEREAAIPYLLGVGLTTLALAPHIVQRSLGLLILNGDEELYFPAANYLMTYAITQGPSPVVMEKFLEGVWLHGPAFQYTLAAVSSLSGSTTFQAYLPTAYCLLGLSVPSWYLFFREVIGLGRMGASVACLLYSLLGLPMWFASYGYGSQMGSLVAVPFATTAFVFALQYGGRRRLLLAGLSVSVGLIAYLRVVSMYFLFAFPLVALLAMIRRRSLRPAQAAIVIVAVALVVGLPSYWYMGQWYVGHGGIFDLQGANWGGGWGIRAFQPPSVGLGLEAFSMFRDLEGRGPLAPLQETLGLAVTPVTVLVLMAASVGLLLSARRRPAAVAIVLGMAAYMAFSRYSMKFPYGYLKVLSIAAPVVYGLVIVTSEDTWRWVGVHGRRIGRPAVAISSAGLLLSLTVLLAYNSYAAMWFTAKGWGLSLPNGVAPSMSRMAKVVEPGSKVFISGRFRYPTPMDRVQLTEGHMLGMQSEEEVRRTWGTRVRAMAVSELFHADIFGSFDTQAIWKGYTRLLDDEDYHYYLLGEENDPRLDGLDLQDMVWSESGMGLYFSRGTVRETPWTLWKERGSLALAGAGPLTIRVSDQDIRIVGEIEDGIPRPANAAKIRLRVGLLAFSSATASVSGSGLSRRLDLAPGVTWFTTPDISNPSVLEVQLVRGDPVGLVAMRALGPGQEEIDATPLNIIGQYLYASSTVLRLDRWLTEPFRGNKPGADW